MPLPSPPRGLTPGAPLPADCDEKFAHQRQLAAGGFGAVHVATHRGLGRAVAVKVLLADLLTDDEQVRRFENEARITAALHHPNLIRILDHGARYGIPWIAYELVLGNSLREMLDDQPRGLPVERALALAAQVADAIAAAHAQGVLHRDIKPENVLLAEDGTCRVTDFGIAKWAREGAVKTATGVVLGTPRYLAPEVIQGAPASPASDIYALGVMLHELLTGHAPYELADVMLLLQQHLTAPVPSARAARPEVPAAVDALLARCLAKAPAGRPASARELAAELAHLAESAAGPWPTRPVPRAGRRAPLAPTERAGVRVRRSPLPAALAVAVAALTLAGALLFRRPPAREHPEPAPSSSSAARAPGAPDLSVTLERLGVATGTVAEVCSEIVSHLTHVDPDDALYRRLVARAAASVTTIAAKIEFACAHTQGRELLGFAAVVTPVVQALGGAMDELSLMPTGRAALEESALPEALRRLRQVLTARVARGYAKVIQEGCVPELEAQLSRTPARRVPRHELAARAAAAADDLLSREPSGKTPADRAAVLSLWAMAAESARGERDRAATSRALDRLTTELTAMGDVLGWRPARDIAALGPLPDRTPLLLTALDQSLCVLSEISADASVARADRGRALALALRCAAGPLAWYGRDTHPHRARAARQLLQSATELGYRDRPELAGALRELDSGAPRR